MQTRRRDKNKQASNAKELERKREREIEKGGGECHAKALFPKH